MNLASVCIYCGALAGVVLAQTDKERALMLPSAVRLSGVVTDSGGTPLSDVWINHTGVRVEKIKTDSHGRFDIETRAPAVVFRKNGFQSKYWRVSGNVPVTVVLTGPAPQAKACRAVSSCLTIKGFMSAFCLPKIHGVNVGKQSNDIDYGQRFFWVKTQDGQAGIQHASGGMWGSGLPLDEDVWSARDYMETTYMDREGFSIIDARGKSGDGSAGAYLGTPSKQHRTGMSRRRMPLCWIACSTAYALKQQVPNLDTDVKTCWPHLGCRLIL